MSDEWVTNVGTTGEITIVRDGDEWLLESPDLDRKVVCIPSDGDGFGSSKGSHRTEVRVSKYTISQGSGPDYLIFSRACVEDDDADTSSRTPGRSSSNEQSSSTGRSNRTTSATSASLRSIAEESIGEEEFTLEQEHEVSVVGKAKRRARRQQRDPAIDPKLQQSDDGEDGS